MKALNVFQPVDGAELDSINQNSWLIYQKQNNPLHPLTGSIGLYNSTEVLIDICTPLEEPTPDPEEAPTSSTGQTDTLDEQSSSWMTAIVPKKGTDWQSYNCSFTFLESTKNVKNTPLSPTGTVRNSEVGTPQVKGIMQAGGVPGPSDFVHSPYSGLNAESENIPYGQTSIITPVERSRYVIMEGYASRFSGPISPPHVLAVGNAIAYQDNTLGMDEVEIKVVPLEMRDQFGNLVEMYTCRWKKHYILDRIPTSGKVETTAIARRFV
jgi:hypothetical protein